MSDTIKSKVVKVMTPAVVGILGTLFALTFPALHSSFCTGIQLPVL